MILLLLCPFLPSHCDFFFVFGCRVSFFDRFHHYFVNGCSTVCCDFDIFVRRARVILLCHLELISLLTCNLILVLTQLSTAMKNIYIVKSNVHWFNMRIYLRDGGSRSVSCSIAFYLIIGINKILIK